MHEEDRKSRLLLPFEIQHWLAFSDSQRKDERRTSCKEDFGYSGFYVPWPTELAFSLNIVWAMLTPIFLTSATVHSTCIQLPATALQLSQLQIAKFVLDWRGLSERKPDIDGLQQYHDLKPQNIKAPILQ